MIKTLTLKHFKNTDEQVYQFGSFNLLVGPNNSGKSTILQALAIWQFCVDEFGRSKRTGGKGVQVVLPNFTALPVPEFNLLWKDRIDRQYPTRDGAKKQEYILISLDVEWLRAGGETGSFGVELRYHSPQTLYAIPIGGWKAFNECKTRGDLPRIAYVPPFSGLEPTEKWMDISPIRQQIGKGQPGGVLRNLLLTTHRDNPAGWKALTDLIEDLFSVTIHEPKYNRDKDVNITVEYQKKNGKRYDIISGGSGFHQTLTLLAFFYGYHPTTILLDEPDAHLHVNLQREILDYFNRESLSRNVQFLIATHAEELVRGVNATQILSLVSGAPKRIDSTPALLRAMADVSNEAIVRLQDSPCILYVEGESDERLLRAWAAPCGVVDVLKKFCFFPMGGGSKKEMKAHADTHFKALREIIPAVKKMMLFDYDDDKTAFHPGPDNPALAEWKRKNIENYLLVPEAWHRAIRKETGDLFAHPLLPIVDRFFTDQNLISEWAMERACETIVDRFFTDQNLTLPAGRTWRDITANIFQIVDGKRILFENDDSLFQALKQALKSVSPSFCLSREKIASTMKADEIHQDVHDFMAALSALIEAP